MFNTYVRGREEKILKCDQNKMNIESVKPVWQKFVFRTNLFCKRLSRGMIENIKWMQTHMSLGNALFFNNHINKVCKKVFLKTQMLFDIVNYSGANSRKLIFNSMIRSQLLQCTLVWIFCSRTLNSLINKNH